jgi:tRNA (guanine-N7-)-methyltransferase
MNQPQHRKVRSFVRRPGRTTAAQKRALETLWPRYGVQAGGKVLDLGGLFGRVAPMVLEIGFGNGEALLTAAANNPQCNYLGVEVHEPGIGHLLLLLERARLDNVRIVAADAVEFLDHCLEPASLDVVNLFFPDPWPKKRHHKRRIVQPKFLADVARALKAGGVLHVATDWQHYAEHIIQTVSANPEFTRQPATARAEDVRLERPPTKFERRGHRLGHEIQDLRFLRS